MGKRNSAEITLESVVQRDPGQEFSMIDDEVVMLSLKNGEYYALNSVASRIWEIIEKGTVVKEITEILMEEFEVDETTCLKDTLECLYDFREKELITGA
ncbi:MAG: PqqD family peptide modification chaperone [Bacteroidales bacterium]|nr:PqqD family peptide modification chaperone [Bacteroidales bacterium]